MSAFIADYELNSARRDNLRDIILVGVSLLERPHFGVKILPGVERPVIISGDPRMQLHAHMLLFPDLLSQKVAERARLRKGYTTEAKSDIMGVRQNPDWNHPGQDPEITYAIRSFVSKTTGNLSLKMLAIKDPNQPTASKISMTFRTEQDPYNTDGLVVTSDQRGVSALRLPYIDSINGTVEYPELPTPNDLQDFYQELVAID